MPFRIGDYVYWSDPDNNLCDTPGHIIDIKANIYVVKTDTGGIVEAVEHELSPLDPALFRTK